MKRIIALGLLISGTAYAQIGGLDFEASGTDAYKAFAYGSLNNIRLGAIIETEHDFNRYGLQIAKIRPVMAGIDVYQQIGFAYSKEQKFSLEHGIGVELKDDHFSTGLLGNIRFENEHVLIYPSFKLGFNF